MQSCMITCIVVQGMPACDLCMPLENGSHDGHSAVVLAAASAQLLAPDCTAGPSRRTRKLIESCKQPPEGSQPLRFERKFACNRMQQFRLLLLRNAREYWRMPEYNTVRIWFTCLFGFVLGSIYWRIGKQRCT